MELRIYSPQKEIFIGKVKEIYVPTNEGDYGIFDDHSPMFLALSLGEISFTDTNNKTTVLAISEGLLRIENNIITIEVISGLSIHDIDINKVTKEKEALEAKLKLMKEKDSIKRIQSKIKLHSLHISTYNKYIKNTPTGMKNNL
jgi:ATP synthase F1 epsilon subunit